MYEAENQWQELLARGALNTVAAMPEPRGPGHYLSVTYPDGSTLWWAAGRWKWAASFEVAMRMSERE